MVELTLPSEALAAAAAYKATGRTPVAVKRFTTGSAHFVFEALLPEGGAVVVRMGRPEQQETLRNGVRLAELLRPLGVPLPRVILSGIDEPTPWVVLERLPGTDLGEVFDSMSPSQLREIAGGVVRAQAAVHRLPAAARFGYAASPEAAPHARWSDVLSANLARSRRRLREAGLFPPDAVDRISAVVDRRETLLQRVAPTPFLHDTTTKNVIIGPDGSLSGIVDVDDFCFGDPRYAAALTEASLAARGRPTTYVRAWLDAAGYADDALFRLYVAVFLLDLMSEHGHAFNGNESTSTDRGRALIWRAFVDAGERASA